MAPKKATASTVKATAAASRPARARKPVVAADMMSNEDTDTETEAKRKPRAGGRSKAVPAPKTENKQKAPLKKTAAKKTTKRAAQEEEEEEDVPVANGHAATESATSEVDEKPVKKSATKKRKLSDDEAPKVKKRAKREEAIDDLSEEETKKPVSRRKAAPKAPVSTKPKAPRVKIIINHAPTQILDIYVVGTGENGELGLGNGKNCTIVKRPRLNPLLAAEKAGVVQVAVGGMHTAVLTKANKILTWGVNDQGALGRDTAWDGGLKDMDADESDSESNEGENMNPKECTPGEVDLSDVPDSTVWTQVVASDSATFALTNTGLVYGCGTFRKNEGVLGFSKETHVQNILTIIPTLRKVTKLAAGANHILALASTGIVYAWGAGQQNQLGRRLVADHEPNGLVPTSCGLPKAMVSLGAGSYHSFAVHKNGKLYGWGLNSYGEAGVPKNFDDPQSADATLPALVPGLDKFGMITQIEGGAHHTIALTDKQEILVWGRLDGAQLGIDMTKLPDESVVKDVHGNKRILRVPTQIDSLQGTSVAAGTDHSLAVSTDGKAYSTGFSASYQTGQATEDDVKTFELIDNTAVREKKLVFAGCGGQFSVLAGVAEQSHGQVNGVPKDEKL